MDIRKSIIRGTAIGLNLALFLGLLHSIPLIIYLRYFTAGLFSQALHIASRSLNGHLLFVLPVFLCATALYIILKNRTDRAFAISYAAVSLAFLVRLLLWINGRDFFPAFFSFKGMAYNALISLGFIAAAGLLYFIVRKIHLGQTYSLISSSAVVLVFLALTIANMAMNPGPAKVDTKGARKVLLIGIDAATMGIILPMTDAGQLPSFKRLMENGSYGRLASMQPTLSPIIWTSIATGKVKEKHGIGDFLTPQTDTGERAPYTSNMRRSKAIWNILGDFSKTSGIVGWWVTWPAERINGYMVSSYISLGQNTIKGTLARDVPRQTFPETFFEQIEGFITQADQNFAGNYRSIFGDVSESRLSESVRAAIADTSWVLKSDDMYTRIGLQILKEKKPDFLAVFIGGIDVVGHRFWKYREPDAFKVPVDPAEAAAMKDVISNYYRYVDGVLGEYLSEIDDQTTVILVSDHGMHAQPKTAYLKSGAEVSGGHDDAPDGIIIAYGKGIRKNHMLRKPSGVQSLVYGRQITADVYDIVPTILYLMGLPTAGDMDGDVLSELFEDENLTASPVRYTGSYEDPGSKKEAENALTTPLDEEMKNRLKGLGYIE
jgi:predicted AlkP superfamily phosphohydrolase/phosphomutase